MKVAILIAVMLGTVSADVFMHVPRGSNDRNCGRSNNDNRENGDRLFDSQNNAKGGYSCPRAFPFPCYKYENDSPEHTACNNQNVPGSKDMVDRWGNVYVLENPFNCAPDAPTESPTPEPTSNPTPQPTSDPTTTTRRLQTTCDVTQNERMKYYSGSVLTIEWTNQHGMGRNEKLHSQVVLQYALEQDMADSCGLKDPEDSTTMPWGVYPSGNKTCHMRDGYPVNNRNTQNADNVNGQATARIPLNVDSQDDYRYGRHETYQYYRECQYRSRNKGLYIADQNVRNDRGATATRQNPNGDNGGNNRQGFECPEESEYYPYWHWSPFRDIAAIISPYEAERRCRDIKSESQNVRPKHRCQNCIDCTGEQGEQPNNLFDCEAQLGEWVTDPAWGIEAPDCFVGKFNRQNHLGNSEGAGSSNQYNWTIPEVTEPTLAILRLRYNISTGDFDNVALFGDARNSGAASMLKDDTNNEAASYKSLLDGTENVDNGEAVGKRQLSFAINSDQHGRVFQDRSYVFEIHPRDDSLCAGTIFNLNVRGKRGNIVQNYPAVEYDFAPNPLVVGKTDCVHWQWDGSDYNRNRGGNNGDGGPYDAERETNANSRADRTNLVQTSSAANVMPMFFTPNHTMFDIERAKIVELAFLNQPIEDQTQCRTIQDLLADETIDNRDDREYHYQNCAKLGGHPIPYYNGGVLKVGEPGHYTYISTRNNNFSNRGEKGVLIVDEDPLFWAYVIIGVVGGLGLAGLAALAYRRKKRNGGARMFPVLSKKALMNKLTMKSGAALSSSFANPRYQVKALHAHVPDEAGELPFNKGDIVTVTKKDPSGWWEGECNGRTGIFPANYVQQ